MEFIQMNRLKSRRCFFIAYDYPPCEAIGGALRSKYFAKYLPEFDWIPDIYTLAAKNNSVALDIPSNVNQIKSLTPFKKPYEVTPYGWAINLWKTTSKYKKDHNPDLIYVSCPPFPQAYTALKLKKIFQCPLVVDFRDAWSLDPYMEGSVLKKLLYRHLFPLMEKKILLGADCFIGNTPSMCSAYTDKYHFLSHKSYLLPNGFNEDDFLDLPLHKTNRKKFSLLYCGRFGIGNRSPHLLCAAIKMFIEQFGQNIQLKILGDNSLLLQQCISQYKLENYILAVGPIPHMEAIHEMAQADVLILYQETSKGKITPIAGKTYEYLRTGRPIIAIAPPGDNLTLIKEHSHEYELVDNYNIQSVVTAFSNMYRKWNSNDLKKRISPSENYLKKFNRKNLTESLSSIFDNLTY